MNWVRDNPQKSANNHPTSKRIRLTVTTHSKALGMRCVKPHAFSIEGKWKFQGVPVDTGTGQSSRPSALWRLVLQPDPYLQRLKRRKQELNCSPSSNRPNCRRMRLVRTSRRKCVKSKPERRTTKMIKPLKKLHS